MVEVFPKNTADFSTIVLNATYLPEGLTAEYSTEEGGIHNIHTSSAYHMYDMCIT